MIPDLGAREAEKKKTKFQTKLSTAFEEGSPIKYKAIKKATTWYQVLDGNSMGDRGNSDEVIGHAITL